MLLYILLLNYFNLVVQALPYSTRGSVWPQVAQQINGQTVYIYDSKHFKYEVTNHTCELIQTAISRCNKNIGIMVNIAEKNRPIWKKLVLGPDKLVGLRVMLLKPCELYPHSGMDESYNLTISSVSLLASNSTWGIIRGLESFSQLLSLTKDNHKVFVRATHIYDRPYYSHRGLMLDTSNNYVLVAIILKILEGMAMSKLNVFHWRIADDQSQSLIQKPMAYTKKNIKHIIHYASELGIRVVPEIGVPLAGGPKNHSYIEGVFLHPLTPITYDKLHKLYKEVQGLFPDDYLHLGEVDLSLWAEDTKIKEYLKTDIDGNFKLLQSYLGKIYSLLKKGTTPVVWQSSKDVEESMPANFIIQTITKSWLTHGVQKLKDGQHVICSIFLNENNQFHVEQSRFGKYYTEDRREILYEMMQERSLDKNILGQEAVIETDVFNEYCIKSRTWLHIAIIAEVLWSHTSGLMPKNTINRLSEHDCRMTHRNVHAGSKVICLQDNTHELYKDANPMQELAEKIDSNILEWRSLVYSLTSSWE